MRHVRSPRPASPRLFSTPRVSLVLTDFSPPSRFPRRHSSIYRQSPSGQSRVYRITQLRADSVHSEESAGTGPVVIVVVRVTGAACNTSRNSMNKFVRPSFPTPAIDTVYSVCVCVCVFSSHPFWTSSSLDVPAGVTQEEGHTGFLIHLPSAVRALIFVARRIQPFLSLVDREVEFCVLTN